MADKNLKGAKNIDGKYYIDNTCISCAQCVDLAGDYFSEDAQDGFYVKAQPTTDEGMTLCEKALFNCPVEAIGNDG